jgi:hypothetical protein
MHRNLVKDELEAFEHNSFVKRNAPNAAMPRQFIQDKVPGHGLFIEDELQIAIQLVQDEALE